MWAASPLRKIRPRRNRSATSLRPIQSSVLMTSYVKSCPTPRMSRMHSSRGLTRSRSPRAGGSCGSARSRVRRSHTWSRIVAGSARRWPTTVRDASGRAATVREDRWTARAARSDRRGVPRRSVVARSIARRRTPLRTRIRSPSPRQCAHRQPSRPRHHRGLRHGARGAVEEAQPFHGDGVPTRTGSRYS